jgi:hypothetical protein
MMPSKGAGRPAKNHLSCNACQQARPPKDGDWFQSADGSGRQIFLCRPCEMKQPRAVRAIPAR